MYRLIPGYFGSGFRIIRHTIAALDDEVNIRRNGNKYYALVAGNMILLLGNNPFAGGEGKDL
jgi:hypothetical protein